jgi:hypothetical protein
MVDCSSEVVGGVDASARHVDMDTVAFAIPDELVSLARS